MPDLLRGLALRRLCSVTDTDPDELNWLAQNAAQLYDEKEIPKKDGNTRHLLVPKPQLKHFQRSFYRSVLRQHRYHPAAYCAPKRGAIAAAERHRGHPYLFHCDLSRFFPSVGVRHVRETLDREGVAPGLVPQLARLLTVRHQLPQGAPTSVAIANLVLSPLDGRLSGLARSKGAGFTYVRYVDDITISGGRRLEGFVGEIRKIVEESGWTLNERGGMFGPDDTHHVLGVIAGPTLTVGEEYLFDIRWTLRALRDGASLNRAEVARLRSRIAWVQAVDPMEGRRLLFQLQLLLSKHAA